MSARIGVITFPGTLDDVDASRAVKLAGGEAVSLWHGDADLKGVDAVIVPGGFSYGDYLRCGAIARFAPVMGKVVEAAQKGMPVLGICNGFQVLCEAGLLPGALTRNAGLHFVCRDEWLKVESNTTAWTSRYEAGAEILIPLKSGEGRYQASEKVLDELEGEGRVVFRFAGATRTVRSAASPASRRRTAGSSVSCRTPSTPPRRSPAPAMTDSACSTACWTRSSTRDRLTGIFRRSPHRPSRSWGRRSFRRARGILRTEVPEQERRNEDPATVPIGCGIPRPYNPELDPPIKSRARCRRHPPCATSRISLPEPNRPVLSRTTQIGPVRRRALRVGPRRYRRAMTATIAMITFDTTDPAPIATWWAERTGGRIEQENDGWFFIVALPQASGSVSRRCPIRRPGRTACTSISRPPISTPRSSASCRPARRRSIARTWETTSAG